MKKLIKFLMLIALVIFGITADYNVPIDNRTAEEKIMETVVIVNYASGIVIYSESKRAIILTAYHVISDNCEAEACHYNTIVVMILRNFIVGDIFFNVRERFDVTNVDVNMNFDLALVEISTDKKLDSARIEIEKQNIKFGNEIYIASNPQYLFRSLKRGIIGSPLRLTEGTPVFEVSGGIIFGSSGGGVFTLGGGLIGVVKSMRGWNTPFCYDTWNVDRNYTGKTCVRQPLPFLGFAIRPEIIKKFIKDSVFCKDFDYGCTKDEVKKEDEQEKIDE